MFKEIEKEKEEFPRDQTLTAEGSNPDHASPVNVWTKPRGGVMSGLDAESLVVLLVAHR